MWQCLLFLLAPQLLPASGTALTEKACETRWIYSGQSCFWPEFENRKTYEQAKEDCTKRGSELASIKHEEKDGILAKAKESRAKIPGTPGQFTGYEHRDWGMDLQEFEQYLRLLLSQ